MVCGTIVLRAARGQDRRLLPRPVPSNLRQEPQERSTYLQAKGTAKLDGPRTYVWGLSRRRDVELNWNCEKSVLSRGVQFLGGYCRANDQSKAGVEEPVAKSRLPNSIPTCGGSRKKPLAQRIEWLRKEF
jgi:hypothetical protein